MLLSMNVKNTYRYLAKAAGIAGLMTLGIAQATSFEEMQERGYMTIVTEDNYAPFEIMQDGEPTGFSHDMLAEFREYADIEIRQEIMPWQGLLSAIQAGNYDMAVTGSMVSTERLRVFDFAQPTASAQNFFIKRRGDDSIDGIASLDGKTVGVQAGSVLLSRLDELEAMLAETGGELGEVVEYPAYPEIYEDLKNGRLDYTVNGIVPAESLMSTRGDEFEIGEPVTGPGFHAYPVPKGEEELLEFVNGFIDHMYETGRLGELQAKWFGREFTDLPRESITSVEKYNELTSID